MIKAKIIYTKINKIGTHLGHLALKPFLKRLYPNIRLSRLAKISCAGIKALPFLVFEKAGFGLSPATADAIRKGHVDLVSEGQPYWGWNLFSLIS